MTDPPIETGADRGVEPGADDVRMLGPRSVPRPEVALPDPLGSGPHRVLFLDDDPDRAEMFLARCPQAVWVTRADACIGRLEEPWDEVHLDHDLNGERFVDVMRDDCGMAVVRWLCDVDRLAVRNARFFIHSHNFAAASLMVECLLRNGYAAEYRPFGYDLVDFLAFAPPPPPRPGGVWRRVREWWSRLLGRRSRVTRPQATRYDDGDPRGQGPRAQKELGSEEWS